MHTTAAPPRRVPDRRRRPLVLPACGIVVAFCLWLLAVYSRPPSVPGAAFTLPTPRSWLAGTTLLTVYGRGFGSGPLLGRLGSDTSMDDVQRQVAPYVRAVQSVDPHRAVRVAIHLIYAMATPCAASPRCLLYLDRPGINIIHQYIEPAARRGWLVILDDQLGRSTPARELRRMASRGYLSFGNVEVAFDPEFHSGRSQAIPGVPVGHVGERELNAAQQLLDAYGASERWTHRKIMLVHEWRPGMIAGARALEATHPYVDPVPVMDGLGPAADKAHLYDRLLVWGHAGLHWRGIKLFPPAGGAPVPVDAPMLNWLQIIGRLPVVDPAGSELYLRPAPNVVVIT